MGMARTRPLELIGGVGVSDRTRGAREEDIAARVAVRRAKSAGKTSPNRLCISFEEEKKNEIKF